MRVAANARGEVDVPAVRAHGGSAGDEIPLRGEVAEARPVLRVEHEEVGRRPAVAGFADDDVEAFVASGDEPRAVGGPGRGGVVVSVVREPAHVAVEVDDPQIRPPVRVFIALVRVRGEREPPAIRAPGEPGGVDAEFREPPRFSPFGGQQVHLAGRRRVRVAGVGEVAPPVEAVVHPVVLAPVEPLHRAALEVGVPDGLRGRRGRRRPGERDPEAVRTEDGRASQPFELERFAGRPVHAEEPRAPGARPARVRPIRREDEEAAVRTPARRGGAEARARHPRGLPGTVGVHEPDLAVATVLLLEDGRDDVRDARSIGREGRTPRIHQPVVVREFERPSFLRGERGRRDGAADARDARDAKGGDRRHRRGRREQGREANAHREPPGADLVA